MAVDPLTQVIEQAVERVVVAQFDARFPTLVASLKAELGKAPAHAASYSDRFFSLTKCAEILDSHPRTVRRRCERGVYPPLKKQGSITGFYQSDLDKIFGK